MEWLETHPNAQPDFSTPRGIIGLTYDNNKDATELEKAIVKGCEDPSGAMVSQAIGHIMYAFKHGTDPQSRWDAYCAESRRRKNR